MTLEELKIKLNEEPAIEEISFLPDGARYLGIDIVRKKADAIFDLWEHSNFVFNIFVFDKETFASGSINVYITINNFVYQSNTNIVRSEFYRKLSGAATIKLSEWKDNPHFAATLKSLCIVNALSNEYPCFGKNLNVSADVMQPQKTKPEASLLEVHKMEQAIKKEDISTMNELLIYYTFGDNQSFYEQEYVRLFK